MEMKKTNAQREPSHTPRFVWAAIGVLLIVVLMIIIANFAAFKTLFWLE